jgi:cation transport ATPase
MKNHIEMLFEDAPQTRKAYELKEELQANSEERYQDLINSGVSPENAFKNVVNSIGNVSELFHGLEELNKEDKKELVVITRKTAFIKTIAVGIYLFSVVMLITFGLVDEIINSHIDFAMIGFILMILIDIIPTCMLVYISSLYPKYRKQEDTIVEDFKEWKSDSLKMKSIKSAFTSVLWTLTVLLYFAISFATFAWYATWIIFLVAICAQAILELVFRLKELK